MTEIEALEKVNELHSKIVRSPFAKNVTESEMLAFIKCKKALEKQIPKKPTFEHNLSDYVSLFICKCGNKIKVHHDSGIMDNNDAPNYCRDCGQKLDWSDEE